MRAGVCVQMCACACVRNKAWRCSGCLGLRHSRKGNTQGLPAPPRCAVCHAGCASRYFGARSNAVCPVIEIPGRTFPVTEFFLPDVIERTGYVVETDSEYARRGFDSGAWDGGGGGGAGWSPGGSADDGDAGAGDRDRDGGDGYSPQTWRMVDRLDPDTINYELIELLLLELDADGADTAGLRGAVLIFLGGWPRSPSSTLS